MQFPNFYIGPMSKNVVDLIISKKFNNKFGIIASRRQIDFNSGYCCNWKTFQFINYVRKKNSKIALGIITNKGNANCDKNELDQASGLLTLSPQLSDI